MLQAYEKQIEILASGPSRDFEEHLQKRWGGPLPQGLSGELRAFIRLLPRLQRRIFSLFVWLPEQSNAKTAAQCFLNYMYEAEDFIPEDQKNGLFGYLDDAYLAALFYERMLEEIDQEGSLRLRQKDRDLLKRAIGLRSMADAVIAQEAIQIKQMLGELFQGEKKTYLKYFPGRKAA